MHNQHGIMVGHDVWEATMTEVMPTLGAGKWPSQGTQIELRCFVSNNTSRQDALLEVMIKPFTHMDRGTPAVADSDYLCNVTLLHGETCHLPYETRRFMYASYFSHFTL